MILALALVAVALSLIAFAVSMAAWKRHDTVAIERRNFELGMVNQLGRIYDFRNTHDQALKEIAVGLKRTINELIYVRDQFYATQSQSARPLLPEGTEASEPQAAVLPFPSEPLQSAGRGITLAAAVRAAEAAGVRGDGDEPRGEEAAQ